MSRGAKATPPEVTQVEGAEFALVLDHLERHGWARLTAPPDVYQALRILVDAAQWFFDRPLAEKLEFDIRASAGHRGYVPTTERGGYADEGERRYEAFDIGRTSRADDVGTHRLRGENRWPDNPFFVRAAESGFETMDRFAATIGRAICDHLGVDHREFERLRTEPISQLRLIRYLAPSVIDVREEPPAAMGAHTDYEFFTILFQVGPGTQILDRDGVWQEPELAPDSLVLFCGDMLEVFSGGRFASTLHRASGTVTAGRLTIPFFCGADFDAVVRPQIGDDRSPVHFGEHLMQQLLRDFPYLRRIGGGPDRASELLIELIDGYEEPQLSRFEQRWLAADHVQGSASG